MLKLLRRYKHILLVGAGVLLMIAFLVPGAIQEMGQQRENVTVMTIGQRSVTAKQYQDLAQEFEALGMLAGRSTLGVMGLTEGPEQWILLTELAARGGYVGAQREGHDYLDDLGRARGITRLRSLYGDQLLNSLLSNPAYAGSIYADIDETDIRYVHEQFDQTAAQARLTTQQLDTALAKLRGVQRMLRSYTSAARVSTPRLMLRAEKELAGAQIEYIFVSADRNVAQVPEPDDATLQAFMEKYKDVKPGEGEYGVGYLLPAREKLEYMVLDAKAIGEKVRPDLRELRRRFTSLVANEKTFDEMRAQLEQELRQETVEKIMGYAQAAVRSEMARATLKLSDDGQFKNLPEGWMATRPTMAQLRDEVVRFVEEKTRPEPGKDGIRIDPPEVVVKDTAYLTREDLAALPGIGTSYIQRGQRQLPFPDYALAVKELITIPQMTLQVGLPCDEPTRDAAGSVYFFTVLDTRKESTPKSIDDIRERLVREWKKVQAYKVLVEQDAEALRQQAIAGGITALDEGLKAVRDPGKPAIPLQTKSGKVTRTTLSTADPMVNSDTFREAVMEVADKLDPLAPPDSLTAEQRTLVVPLPEKLGLAVVRIRSLAPLTTEDFRSQQSRLAGQYQIDEFRSLNVNPFSVERLRQRMNVRFVGPDADKRNAASATEG